MFIERAKDDEIPKGAVRLSNEEVYDYITNLIRKWPNKSEMSVCLFFTLMSFENSLLSISLQMGTKIRKPNPVFGCRDIKHAYFKLLPPSIENQKLWSFYFIPTCCFNPVNF